MARKNLKQLLPLQSVTVTPKEALPYVRDCVGRVNVRTNLGRYVTVTKKEARELLTATTTKLVRIARAEKVASIFIENAYFID